MKHLLSIIALLTAVSSTAQVHTIENYSPGTKIDYYIGECGNDIPEAEGKITFCDEVGNLGVVDKSFGLNYRGIDRMESNFYNDDRIFVTRNGLSIWKEDGSWDNIPNRAVPVNFGDPGENDNRIREAVYLPSGVIVFHGNGIGTQVDLYNPETKELWAIALPGLNSHPHTIEYDPDRDLVWIIGGSGTDRNLFSLQGDVLTFVHDLDISTINPIFTSDVFAYADDALWLASSLGLTKVDLLDDYAEIFYDNTTTELLPFDQVNDIEVDVQGMVWLAQDDQSPTDGGLTRLDPLTDTYSVYQIEDEDPGGFNVRFQTIGVDAQGHVWAVTNDYPGTYELDISTNDPIWTLHANATFDDIDLPYIYNFGFIHGQNGRTYFCTNDGSSSANDQFELLINEAGEWSGKNDNEVGNFSRRMSNVDYGKCLSDPDGGLWWFDQNNDEFMYLKDEDNFYFEHSTGYLGIDQATISGSGDLTMRMNSEVGLYEIGSFTPYEDFGGQSQFYMLKSTGISVWAFQSQSSSDNLLVRYVNGEVVQQTAFEELASYFNFAPLSNGDVAFARSSGGQTYVQVYDHLTENVTLNYTSSESSTIRNLIAGNAGDYWLITDLAILYFDGSSGDPLILNSDNTDLAINGLQDAVLDTDMNLHVVQGTGIIYTISPPYDNLAIETLQFSGNSGVMPHPGLFGSAFKVIGLDADGDIWTSRVQDQIYRIKDDNDAGEFHVDVAVGLAEEIQDFEFQAYPNPLYDGQLTIVLPKDLVNAQAILYDIRGAALRSFSISTENEYLDLSGVSDGIYILELRSDLGIATKKVIIKDLR